ncbi:MAG: P27 family phage terminase small subunit [Gaiellaceae bacterium]
MATLSDDRPAPPDSLGDAGAALWLRLIGYLADDWELDERELHLLESACHVRDDIAELEGQIARDGHVIVSSRGAPTVHPALQETRQLRTVELRLLKSLQLSDVDDNPTSRKARAAAQARWDRTRGVRT